MKPSITILGAGLVGSLLAIMMRQKGYEVKVYERRPDMRQVNISAGRSINFAMSERGWKALALMGMDQEIRDMSIQMPGRMLHQSEGDLQFQHYGKKGESIYSVSRADINKALMNRAEKEGAEIFFEHKALDVDLQGQRFLCQLPDGSETLIDYDFIFGADGAYSALRTALVVQDRTNYNQHYLDYGYKELSIPKGKTNENLWQIEKKALHIWPRRNFMMIALPNLDGSFTCTLFAPFEGKDSFAQLNNDEAILKFFQKEFPDALPLMPTLLDDFKNNPTSSLITTKVYPWIYKDSAALIGDAAHAVVPFYGQGLNAGFEDISILHQLLEENEKINCAHTLKQYQELRKENADALAELAYLNFIEMRDLVADQEFLLRKQIEQDLGRDFPHLFNSVYEMVSFTHTPYVIALKNMELQSTLLAKIMATPQHYFEAKHDPQYQEMLSKWLKDYEKAHTHLKSQYGFH